MPNYDPREEWGEDQMPRGDEIDYFPNLWVEDLGHLWAVHQGKVTVAVYPKEKIGSKYDAWKKAAYELDAALEESCNGLSDEDAVNEPSHYTVGGYEAIDVIRSKLTDEEYVGYCKGNVLKYLMRANYKGHHDTDCLKAGWYMEELNDAIQVREEDS